MSITSLPALKFVGPDIVSKVRHTGSTRPLLPLAFNLKGKPYTLERHFPFEPLFNLDTPKKLLLKCGRQVSKTVSDSAECRVYLSNGRPVSGRELAIGDRVLSVDANRRAVEGVVIDKIANPGKSILRVTTRTGVVLDIADTHPLQRLTGWTQAGELVVGDRIAALRVGGDFVGVPQPRERIVLTAYFLGDGSTRSENFHVTNIGPELRAECTAMAQRCQNYPVRTSKWNVYLSQDARSPFVHWLREDGSFDKYAWEKWIPAWVYDLSAEDTALFVSSLWATDGMIKTNSTGKPTISYTSTSRKLAYDVKALLTKFGIPSSVARREAGYRKKCGTYKRCRDAYVLRVETQEGWRKFFAAFTVPDKPPVSIPDVVENNNRDTLPREVAGWIAELAGQCRGRGKTGPSLTGAGLRMKPKYPPTYGKLREYVEFFREHRAGHPRLVDLESLLDGDVLWDEIVSIESLGVTPCWDIEVATEHNYVLDGIVSHNSTGFASEGLLFHAMTPDVTTLYITPLFEMIRRFSNNYVSRFIKESPIRKLLIGSDSVNSVGQKSFRNSSHMQFSFAWMDAERTRGISSDRMFTDELQDMQYDLIPIIRETLSGSENWGIERYAGTPKSMDNTIEKFWEDSSQAEWVIRCHAQGCGHFNVPAAYADLLDMIQPPRDDVSMDRPGICCSKCKSPLLSHRYGRWVHQYPERQFTFPGYHVPQIVLPMHYAVPEKYGALYGKKMGRGNTTINVFMNEVCGESFDTGSSLVTGAELRAAACLPWKNSMDAAKPYVVDYVQRIVGVDWGGAGEQGTSFTVLSVCGLKADGTVDVLWASRVIKLLDYEYEARLILGAMKFFDCSHMAHDYGTNGGGRETLIHQGGLPLENIVPIRYTAGSGRQAIMIRRPATDNHPRAWYALDRSRSLVHLCQAIKRGALKFFSDDYNGQEDRGLLRDFLALREEKSTSMTGLDLWAIVRKPTEPDDFVHATNYAAAALWTMHDAWPTYTLAPANQKFELNETQLAHVIGPGI